VSGHAIAPCLSQQLKESAQEIATWNSGMPSQHDLMVALGAGNDVAEFSD